MWAAPRIFTARPPATVTSIAQVSGQSCGQAARTRVSTSVAERLEQ
jgi:hypothetical protein